MSNRESLIVEFNFDKVEPHGNAEKLSIYKIPGTEYVYVLNTEEWKEFKQGKCVYVEPESLCDVRRPEFAFLASDAKYHEDSTTGASTKNGLPTYARIKAKKLRGVVSFGLLVRYNGNLEVGQDASEELGIKHYNPEIASAGNGKGFFSGGEVASPPEGYYPTFDIENAKKYARKLFEENELVSVSEKIHGSLSRFVYRNGIMNCGSKNEWKKEYSSPPKMTLEELIIKTGDEIKAKEIFEKVVVNFTPKKNLWWTALEQNPAIKVFCEANPCYTLYGEIASSGIQKGFNYKAEPGKVRFFAFDILGPDGKWLTTVDFWKLCDKFEVNRVPVLEQKIPFNFEYINSLAQGKTKTGDSNILEGVVARAYTEDSHPKYGRKVIKFISPEYLSS